MKLGNLIADCALRHPEREVIVCNDRRISFGELDRNANRLANAYTARGMQIGDRLAMFLPNSAELIEAMCGAAKSGGIIVPIATRLAPREVEYILGDCEPWCPAACPGEVQVGDITSATSSGAHRSTVDAIVGGILPWRCARRWDLNSAIRLEQIRQ